MIEWIKTIQTMKFRGNLSVWEYHISSIDEAIKILEGK
jgi:hypothetical protein